MLTTPLLEGLDGVNKMSKSLGNFVGIAEPPGEQFGKLLSLPDELMPRYFTLTTGWHPDRIDEVTGALADGSLKPVDAKRLLARTVVDLYHGDGAGEAAQAEFDRCSGPTTCPTDIAERRDPGRRRRAPRRPHPRVAAARAWRSRRRCRPTRRARRKIEQGGVRLDGEVVDDPELDGHAGRGRREDRSRWASGTGPGCGPDGPTETLEQGQADDAADHDDRDHDDGAPEHPALALHAEVADDVALGRVHGVGVLRRRAHLGQVLARLALPVFLPLDPMGGETSVRPARNPPLRLADRGRQPVVSPIRPGNAFRVGLTRTLLPDPAPSGSGGGRSECRLGARGTVARLHGRQAFRCRVVAP